MPLSPESKIKDWIDLLREPHQFIQAVMNITKPTVRFVPGISTFGTTIDGFLKDQKITSDEAQKALDHLQSLKAKK